MAGEAYPRMLFRPGSQYRIWGRDVDTLIVDDEVAEVTAATDGWMRRPDDETITVEAVEQPTTRRGPGRPRKVVETE